MENNLMLKTIVGSQAHGLATPESDFDYRGVFIHPTSEILKLGSTTKTTSWIEGKDDDTSWELAHFLSLATKCNPTILEVFLSPIAQIGDGFEEEVKELRDLFPYVWNSQYVHDSFIGYAHNQRKKMIEDKDSRPYKYAAAYLRTMWQGAELLNYGTFTIRIADTEMGDYIKAVKSGKQNTFYDISKGAILNKCNELEQKVHDAYARNPDKQTDIDKVNEYLLKMRQKYWTV